MHPYEAKTYPLIDIRTRETKTSFFPTSISGRKRVQPTLGPRSLSTTVSFTSTVIQASLETIIIARYKRSPFPHPHTGQLLSIWGSLCRKISVYKTGLGI